MPRLCRVLLILTLTAPAILHAGDLKIKISVSLHGWWWPFEHRYAPEVSPHHLGAAPAPAPATDSCAFVAGVRHCPLPKPRAESR
jgi:hypothetical protein